MLVAPDGGRRLARCQRRPRLPRGLPRPAVDGPLQQQRGGAGLGAWEWHGPRGLPPTLKPTVPGQVVNDDGFTPLAMAAALGEVDCPRAPRRPGWSGARRVARGVWREARGAWRGPGCVNHRARCVQHRALCVKHRARGADGYHAGAGGHAAPPHGDAHEVGARRPPPPLPPVLSGRVSPLFPY